MVFTCWDAQRLHNPGGNFARSMLLGHLLFRLTGQEPKIFGFAEYLAALALLVLAWTIADFRYRFRIQTVPVPLRTLTFGVVAGVGFLSLATDLWRAERWYVPRGQLISAAEWQALLGVIFLVTFLMWAWFAFVRPQSFGRLNAFRFAQALYRTVLKGDRSEIAIVADELASSIRAIIAAAPQRERRDKDEIYSAIEGYSQDIMLLMGDRRLCKAMVASSPGTILRVFSEIEGAGASHLPLQAFAQNLINEAIRDLDSFIYHEEEGYRSGLMGYYKPITQAIFSNYETVAGLETLLDPDVFRKEKWEAIHWEAYGRLILITLKGYVGAGRRMQHSYVLHRAYSNISHSCMDIYQIHAAESSPYEDDRQARLRVAVQVLKKSVEALNALDQSWVVRRFPRREEGNRSIFDLISESIVEVVKFAASVKGPRSLAWSIQYNYVWGEFFGFHNIPGAAAAIVKFKVRRLLYDEVMQLERFHNFQSATVLGFLLNVLGLDDTRSDHSKDTRALHVALLRWTRRNYIKIYRSNTRLAAACLVEGVEFDAANSRLTRVYGLNPTDAPKYAYLDLDPVSD